MYVKAINATTNSWFNIKMKGELAILVEASEAVDVKGIEEVYEQYIGVMTQATPTNPRERIHQDGLQSRPAFHRRIFSRMYHGLPLFL